MTTSSVADASVCAAAAQQARVIDDWSGSLPEPYRRLLEECRLFLLEEARRPPFEAVLTGRLGKGKLLRGMLVLLAGGATGGSPDFLMPAAVAVELLHMASLVHDDLIDGSDQRRGLPAVHVEIGAGPALVVGDYLLSRSFAMLVAARSRLPGDRVLAAAATLSEQAQRSCEGEAAELRPDLFASAPPDPPERHYRELVSGKTAATFSAAVLVGATLAGACDAQRRALGGYAQALGMVFQLHDDLVDALIPGRLPDQASMPVLYLRAQDPAAGRRYEALVRAGEIAAAVDLLHAHDVLRPTYAIALREVSVALANLARLPACEPRDLMAQLARTLGNASAGMTPAT